MNGGVTSKGAGSEEEEEEGARYRNWNGGKWWRSSTEDAWCELVNVLSFLRAANNISIRCLVPYPGVTLSEIQAGRACMDVGDMGKERRLGSV